jgi:hypothetical protein
MNAPLDYEQLQSRYRPDPLEVLLVGESPPAPNADIGPIAPGSTRRQCFPFEVEQGVGLSEVQLVVTTDEGGTATGIWSLP